MKFRIARELAGGGSFVSKGFKQFEKRATQVSQFATNLQRNICVDRKLIRDFVTTGVKLLPQEPTPVPTASLI